MKHIFQEVLAKAESISVQGYNEKHEVIYWNDASEVIYGYTKDEALGNKLEELIIPKEMRSFVHNAIEAWINEDIEIPSSELVLIDKYNNNVNVFSQHVMLDMDDGTKEMYCLDINLADIKKLQTELQTEKIFLNTIFDVIPDLIWLKDKDGIYLKCNKKFEEFFGAKELDIVGKTDFDFVDKDLAQFFRDNDLISLEAGRSIKNEEYLVFADGSNKGTYETIKTPLKSNTGEVTGILGIARDITNRKTREKELETLANYDTLTGLTNRTIFMDRLTQLLNKRDSHKLNHAVLFIDLDSFKEINDTMGHNTGDELLKLVSSRLNDIIRQGDTLARLGGDEFIILAENILQPLEASSVAKQILKTLKDPFIINDKHFYITSSIGISIFPDDSTSAQKLLQYADSAMYKAKENGKDTYEFYTKNLSKEAMKRVSILNDLRVAIKNNEFELYYQAQTDAKILKTVGVEALIRWNHPIKGLISPFEFIQIAESSGKIIEIGKWVIEQAMRDIVSFRKQNHDVKKVSINLSVKQLNDVNLLDNIKKSLKTTKCEAKWVEFEVTETYIMDDPESSIIMLNELVNLGFTLSIDDFGTGYSSLTYLKKLPVKKLKIDKSFVDDIAKNNDDEAIVDAVILIAKSMNLEVIAEGVETQEQQNILLAHGCSLTQGYLYSRPIPKKEFEDYISLKSL